MTPTLMMRVGVFSFLRVTGTLGHLSKTIQKFLIYKITSPTSDLR